MVHILIDDWLYADVNGELGTYGREELQRNFKTKIKAIAAAFLDCEVSHVAAIPSNPSEKQKFINASFSNDFLIQEERLSVNESQILAAPKAKIEEIYQYFKSVKIETLVPYPVSIRAFLKSRSLLPEDKLVIFVDDLKNQAIVTVFEGLRFAASRRISMRDMEYMGSEIRRSRQNFLNQCSQNRQEQTPTVIISNNQQWLTSFIEQGWVSKKDVVHIDCFFPVLEGLKNAKFGIHFALPQELARQKRRQLALRRWKAAAIVGLALLVSAGMYGFAFSYRNSAAAELALLKEKKVKAQAVLAQLNQRKFQSLRAFDRPLSYQALYYNFVRHMPFGYVIQDLQINCDRPKDWLLSAIIYPQDNQIPVQDFKLEGLFAKAAHTSMPIKQSLGQKIELTIDPQKDGL